MINQYPSFYDRPCAAVGYDSYRYRGQYGWVMIGANSIEDALREAKRSTDNVDIANLQKWNGSCYIGVTNDTN